MKVTKEQTNYVLVNEAFLNVITPMKLEIKKKSLVVGENTGKVYCIIQYP